MGDLAHGRFHVPTMPQSPESASGEELAFGAGRWGRPRRGQLRCAPLMRSTILHRANTSAPEQGAD
jgi:hypothetical protein